MAGTLLTAKEQRILKLRYGGISNADIARKLDVSPADITQTFKRIVKKLRGANDTLRLMREIGIMEDALPIELTAKGRSELAKIARITIAKPAIKIAPPSGAPTAIGDVSYSELSTDVSTQSEPRNENAISRWQGIRSFYNYPDMTPYDREFLTTSTGS